MEVGERMKPTIIILLLALRGCSLCPAQTNSPIDTNFNNPVNLAAPSSKDIGFRLLQGPPQMPGDTNPPAIIGMAVVNGASFKKQTNPPPSISLAFDLTDPSNTVAAVQVYVGHGEGWTTNYLLSNPPPLAVITFTNVNLEQPYVFRAVAIGTNGWRSDTLPQQELWWNVRSNGAFFASGGREYLSFAEDTNHIWMVRGAMGNTNLFYSDIPKTNRLAQVPLGPGYYRITSQ